MPTLDWLNREAAFSTANQVPTRVLRPHASLGTAGVLTGAVVGDAAAAQGNLLVQGDNLEALKALLPFYRGQVKCVFIDPPYNTKSAFEHYDDNLEHAQWLSMMLPRLQLLREFLREDGSIWVTIDDNEGHYLKVLMDEVFGRGNFIANVVWEKKYSPKTTRCGSRTHMTMSCFTADLARCGGHCHFLEPMKWTLVIGIRTMTPADRGRLWTSLSACKAASEALSSRRLAFRKTSTN
jgi:adenine-specific DNA-methyltransferase